MLCGACCGLSGTNRPCIFCDVSEEKDFHIAKEDSQYVMFMDKWPGAAWHYLVVPKVHIGSVQDLTTADIDMVEGLLAMGKSHFDSEQVPENERRFGFHIPPFTAIQHLHLHCLGMPFKNGSERLKYFQFRYDDGSQYTKGWGWFIEVDQAIRILRN